jgi:ubiquinone/menaquinone biosynthesis C-methylase UbiE
MRFFSTMVPLFLTASAPEKLTELKSCFTPGIPRLLHKFERGLGLDVNCWTGESTNHLQKTFPQLQFHGVDGNGTAIQIAQCRFQSAKFSVSDLEKLNKNTESSIYQVIQISDYNNLKKILSNTYPMLHHDGFIILYYKKDDQGLINELYEKNLMFPRRKKNGVFLDNMYLLEKENIAIILK